MYVCLNDLVDTLKLQFYPADIEADKMIFNAFVDIFLVAKRKAMDIKNEDSQERYVSVNLNGIKLRVMASSQNGFNVVCQNADFTLSFRKISEHKNPVVKAEFRSEFLLRNGYTRAIKTVVEYVGSLLKNYFIKVSELHLAKDIQGYNFNILDFYRLKTLKKLRKIHNQDTELFFSGLKFTGFSIGKGAEMLRIYNKTHKIEKDKKTAFVKYLSWEQNPKYDDTKTVWRIEFQLRREKLKELCSSFGLIENLDSLLKSISSIWNYLINTFVLKDFSNKECQEIQSGYKINDDEIIILSQEAIKKRFQRAVIHPLWLFMSEFKGNIVEKLQKIRDVSKPAVMYVKNAFKAVLSTFIKLKRGSFNASELVEILLNADKELQQTKHLGLVDNARLKTLDFCTRAEDFLNHSGIDVLEIHKYKKDLKNNLDCLFTFLDTDSSNITTFKEFRKRIA
ncbi:hypothetical protein AFAEC_1127 [Aliarcobacter faecis]|uniref:hypothetical protein n=1 Tax=Aliarcobacter faecis TaxID=1564138 RepID=UPI00047BE134|nr:hypothetical protein [Aliarcobacter faecis]QKF73278.1 hypothetical protein AFAEC_1112 [Aliarcobacter faecis]QKF73293.1 hypothetical protein AFAEC_1127 [Aliarcobacter faecis]